MVSATMTNTQPHLPMAEDKKSIKSIIKGFFKKDKKEKPKLDRETVDKPKTAPQVTPVSTLLENFKKLEIQKKEADELKNFTYKAEEDDELKHFTFKAVEEERRTERTDSQSSQDSGFSEKDVDREDKESEEVLIQEEVIKTEKDVKREDNENEEVLTQDDVIKTEKDVDREEENEAESKKEEDAVLESLKNLKLEDGKKKTVKKVTVARKPVKNKVADFLASTHPYDASESHLRQISQINKQTFSGGQVIVNQNVLHENLSEVDIALKKIELHTPHFTKDDWDLVQEFIDEDSSAKVPQTPENLLEGFNLNYQENLQINVVHNKVEEATTPKAIEEFNENLNYEHFDPLELTELPFEEEFSPKNDKMYHNIYPTPPRSENVPSPMSDSQASYYPTISEFSPQLSSPNSDYEKYQEISPIDDQYPSCVSENFEKDESIDKKPRERNASTSSMTMKQYKDLQKDIAASFSKKECCQDDRKTCKELFQEYFAKLKEDERKSLFLKVTSLDLKTAYGVLHHILVALARDPAAEEPLQHGLFALLCEQVLARQPSLFTTDFGLSLLKAAALRCPSRPLLTRYLVQCVRTAIRVEPALAAGKDCLFEEIDAQGDNLVIACARAGDAWADVLGELVRREPQHVPLFAVDHVNTEGYTALHVACRLHSASSPRAHVTHTLLEHATADLWRGDVKGGDTALHLAVNSPSCELRLILVIFRHLNRKEWKKLAHVSNRSSVTPLEYARCAAKSTTRQNYPQEVLEFLKRCR